MSKKMKITIIATVIIIIFITVLCSFNSVVSGNEAEVRKLYSLDGRETTVLKSQVNQYLSLGWYRKPVMEIYNIKKEKLIIYKDEFNSYYETGWREHPVMYVYNLNQEKIVIYQSEFQKYKALGWYDKPVEINMEDAILLARVIHAEATQNPNLRVLDRQYVGAVVMNRVRHSGFPNTVRGVIYAPKQYACVGNYWFNQYPPQECIDIAKQLLAGETFGVPANVVFQAQFTQGKGIWKRVGVHYYCYI